MLLGFAVAIAGLRCCASSTWRPTAADGPLLTLHRGASAVGTPLRRRRRDATRCCSAAGPSPPSYVTDDPFVRLFSFGVTLAYMIGTPGRNFASDRLVAAQIIGDGVPLSAALFFAGGFYYAIFGAAPAAVLRRAEVHLRPPAQDAARRGHRQRATSALLASASTPRSTTCRTACACSTPTGAWWSPTSASPSSSASPRDVDRKGQTVRELLLDCVEAGVDPALGGRPARRATSRSGSRAATPSGFNIAEAGRAHAQPHLPADGERRLGRADRGHHRAARRPRRASAILPATIR